MVGTMLVMMHLCTTVKAEEGTIVTRRLLGQPCNRTVRVKARLMRSQIFNLIGYDCSETSL